MVTNSDITMHFSNVCIRDKKLHTYPNIMDGMEENCNSEIKNQSLQWQIHNNGSMELKKNKLTPANSQQ